MKPKASRLATLAILLGVGLVVAGCAAPQEADEREVDVGDDVDAGSGDRGIRPTLPAFDPNATDEGAGNETTASP